MLLNNKTPKYIYIGSKQVRRIEMHGSIVYELVDTLELICDSSYTSTGFQVEAAFNGNTISPSLVTFSITQSSQYCSIDANGYVTINDTANNSPITIVGTYGGKTCSKNVTVTYKKPNTVVNLLPKFVQANWVFDRMTISNPTYDPSNYSGESVRPEGNVVILRTSTQYSECYTYPVASLYPMLKVGHTYYLRWLSRKEQAIGSSNNNGISEDVYWPEMENALYRTLNSSHYTRFRKNSYTFTLQQSQWPNNTVQDGQHKIRFDINNQKKDIKHFCLADFMLIDLTETYTDRGLSIPSNSTLTAKPYFYGEIDLSAWA